MPLYLAMDGGGTATRAGLYDGSRNLIREVTGRASNPVAYGIDTCLAVLTELARRAMDGGEPPPQSVAVALAGAREAHQKLDIATRLADALGASRVLVTDDLRPILFANAGDMPAILAIAGTGSSVLAQNGSEALLVGGRGAILGDDGSAYRVAVAALRACAHALDGLGPATELVEALPEAVGLAAMHAMPAWAETADKQAIADLARTVERLAEQDDQVALACLRREAAQLAAQVEAGHRRLHLPPDVCVYLHGGLLTKGRVYREAFISTVHDRLPRAEVRELALSGHRAVVEMALADALPAMLAVGIGSARTCAALPATERSHDVHLDALSPREIVRHMNHADRQTVEAVHLAENAIVRAVELAAQALRDGGRIVYAGAGTSGRLGVLDASECPPTFGVSPDRVAGLIAGGDKALRSSIEGAEDDRLLAARDIGSLEPPLGPQDMLVGIAASGTTPYVLSAIDAARAKGVVTALLCCNPAVESCVDVLIALDTGPEVLPGSTRLKAGTATKMVLNMISTGAMALSGHVFEGHMVGMRPTNAKLRRRAIRMLCALTGLDADSAQRLLDDTGGNIGVAVVSVRAAVDIGEASNVLARAKGNVREALETIRIRKGKVREAGTENLE